MNQLTASNINCKYILLCLIMLTVQFASAQLKADFTIDKASGCSPLTVSFTNTSTGTSGSTTYKWDFGNGNSSVIANAGATYKDEKTYTVTLTVKDGALVSTKSANITVYQRPTVAFTASVAKGCMPLPVTFTSSSTAGNGTISNYFWDFGDGNTQQGQSASQVPHTYGFSSKPSVSLTVTNSHGCYNTLEKQNIVDVLAGINADFSANKTVLCKETDAVSFINKSRGPGKLSFSWDFGDGKTSTEENPTYTFNKKGVYTVKLTAKNEDGCSANITQTNYLNVANFKTDFSIPQLVCKGTSASFTNNSSPTPNYSTWTFTEGGYPIQYAGAAYHTYNTAGSYKVKLTNNFGGCEESAEKTVEVKDAPNLQGFIMDKNGVCGAPVSIKFKDTTSTAVKWEWDFNYYSYYNFQSASNLQAPTFNYTSDGYYHIGLRVTNASGCTSPIISQYMNISKPNVNIYYISSTSPAGNRGCPGFTMKFAASSSDEITDYKWDFGDGKTSTEKTPEYLFNTAGNYNIKLSYTTKGGCKDVATYNVQVDKKPEADFESFNGTSICGNSPVFFTDKSKGMVTNWTWDYGDMSNFNAWYQNPVHQYQNEGSFTVKLIARNGSCADTIEKKNYIQVAPPFPKITGYINSCEGTRGEVTLQHTSKQATKWVWDFGDNSTPLTLTSDQYEVKHIYTKTGSYKVVLTTTNGQCSVKDSMTVHVLLKQKPVISASQNSICGSDNLQFKVSELENNPYNAGYSYNHFYFSHLEYGDGSRFNGGNTSTSTYYWTNTYTGTLNGLESGKENIRAILRSSIFGCNDTTNYLPLLVKGPMVGFKVADNGLCFKLPISFIDTSKGRNSVAIKKWEWDFGDGGKQTSTKSETAKHQYALPGGYYVSLKVTDAEGCTASTPYYNNYVQASGPKASISVSPSSSVHPNTMVYFYNYTNNYNSYNTQYKWLNKDGSTSSGYYSISKYYSNIGTDTVRLIAINPDTKCTDTAMQVIYIKNVTAAFTFTTNYINNNSCPPLLARFTSQSTNANKVSWNFGDGGIADNQNSTSHTYYKPGTYKVVLYAYGANNAMDSTIEYVTVKGPSAKLKSDTLHGCSTLNVTLSAEVQNASSYTWDLGDGTLKHTQDTFAVHQYLTPGIYTPSLIMKDGSGCSATFELNNKIIIDSLHVSIKGIPAQICDSAEVSFHPDVKSIAADQMQQTLFYKWVFGTGEAKDTSDLPLPTFTYLAKGNYEVNLKVVSPYGCEAEKIDKVSVYETVKGKIAGPDGICEGGAALFTGSASSNNPIKWTWSFGNGSTSTLQNPEVQTFKSPGNYTIQLEVERDGCKHISFLPVSVHTKPLITILPQKPLVCLGNSIELVASGGVTYSWTPAEKLSNSAIANPVANPEYTSNYSVKVTNEHGCENLDSVTVTVARPFKMEVNANAFVCEGNSVQLTASGAATYKWTDPNLELSNASIANPLATPRVSTQYTVIGSDAYQCFTNKAEVKVTVKPRPTVNAGADIEMLTGDTKLLQPTFSNDVTEWQWSPADYLSCTRCATPTVVPRKPLTYSVIVKNQYGCERSDSLQINLLCSDAYIFIPNGFTPNNDQKNDLFFIKGKGVSLVKSIRIFNRWGALVFEKKNFYMDDRASAWDGKQNGKLVPAGSYVYITELQCDGGDAFTKQGTVTVVY